MLQYIKLFFQKVTMAKREKEEKEEKVKEATDRLEREKASNGWLEDKVKSISYNFIKLSITFCYNK